MERILVAAVVVYLLVGFGRASDQLRRGIMGSAGPLVTLVAVTLFWPFLS